MTGFSMRRIYKVKVLSVLLALLFLAGCGAPASSSVSVNSVGAGPEVHVLQPTPSSLPSSQMEPQPVEHIISFSAVGDNLIHNSIYESARAMAGGEGYDFSYAYENIKHYFEDFTVNWINQETLVNDELPPATYPCFSTPGELGRAAYDAGWRVFALSNNHTYDKGSRGIAATLEFWSGMPEDTVTYGLYTDNESDDSIVLQEKNGMTIAYLAYTEHTNG